MPLYKKTRRVLRQLLRWAGIFVGLWIFAVPAACPAKAQSVYGYGLSMASNPPSPGPVLLNQSYTVTETAYEPPGDLITAMHLQGTWGNHIGQDFVYPIPAGQQSNTATHCWVVANQACVTVYWHGWIVDTEGFGDSGILPMNTAGPGCESGP